MSQDMNAIDALKWLARHHGMVRWETDGTVTAIAYGLARRALTLGDAMTALANDLPRMPVDLAHIERWTRDLARKRRTSVPIEAA